MKIELEFLDNTKCRLHEQEMEYDGAIPVPSPGDCVSFGGEVWQVERRDFIYLSGKKGFADLKVSMWVKKPERT